MVESQMRHNYIILFLLLFPLCAAAQAPAPEDSLYTGSSKSAGREVLGIYPTLDLMNSFTGVLPGLWVTENAGATGVRYHTENCSLSIRGFSGVKYIVDGIVLSEPEQFQLDPEDIESVTLVSGIVDKARFGPEASRGAVYIRTVRGLPKGREIRFTVQKGVDMVDRMPGWLGASDYAVLNNQAREAASFPVLFDDEALRTVAKNDIFDYYYPAVNWQSLMLKRTRDFTKAGFLVRGGGSNVSYSTHIGWAHHGDIYAMGPVSDFNRFNADMSIDVRLNHRIRAEVNFIALYTMRRSPLVGGTTNNTYEFPSVLSLLHSVPSTAYPLYVDRDSDTGVYNWTVSARYPDNPYANLYDSGFYTETGRTGLTDAVLHYDLGGLLPGLRSETRFGLNVYYSTRIGMDKDYVGVIYDPQTGIKAPTSHMGTSATSKSQFLAGYLQGLQFNQRFSYDKSWGRNAVTASLGYNRSHLAYSIEGGYHQQQNVVMDLAYSRGGRFKVESVLNYAGTSARKRGHRYELFPTLGVSWRPLDWVKLRTQGGILGYEPYGGQYYWQSRLTKGSAYTFGPYSSGQWFGTGSSISVYSTTVSRYANEDLGWEKNKEFEIGADFTPVRNLSLGITYYHVLQDGIVVDISSVQPYFYGPGALYDNYNANVYDGVELNAEWSGKLGQVQLGASAFATVGTARYRKVNESYSDKWQNREGKRIGSIWGLECIGKFASDEEIAAAPSQNFDATLYPGDLRYLDYDESGEIDSHDIHVIGNSSPLLRYAVNLNLAWKRFDFTIVGTGKAFFDSVLNNAWFWNGWGDGNYSTFVRDNLGGAYPRLSYLKSENNFRVSDFWIRRGDFFKIQSVEAGVRFGKVRFCIRGANLLTISGIKDVDPESLSSGVSDYPLFRTVTGGLTLSF